MASPLFTLAFIAALCVGLGYGMGVEVAPGNEVEAMSEKAVVACILDDVGGTVKSIESVEISRDGSVTVGYARRCASNNCTSTSEDNYKMEAMLGDEASQSFVNLTIEKPKSGDSGEYICTCTYIDNDGKLKTDKASGKLEVKKLENDKLEKILEDLKKKVDELSGGCNCTGGGAGGAAESGSGAGGAVAAAAAAAAPEEKKVSAFAVTNNKEVRAFRGRTLVLPDLIMQEGPGFDVSTGVFTAEWKGLYVFHLALALAGKSSGTIVQLRHNNKDIMFRIYAADKSYDDQTAASTVVYMEKGDTVSCFIEAASGSKLYDNRKYTVFSGYLLQTLPEAPPASS